MTPQQLNKCLQKFYLLARRPDGTFNNKKLLFAFVSIAQREFFCPSIRQYIVTNKVTLWYAIQLVWYILKQLFTLVSVVDFHFHFGDKLLIIFLVSINTTIFFRWIFLNRIYKEVARVKKHRFQLWNVQACSGVYVMLTNSAQFLV